MKRYGSLALFVVLCFSSLTAVAKDSKLTVQEVIQKSLDAIGTPEARAAANARHLTGTVQVKQLAGRGFADLTGAVSLMTIAPNQTRLQMKFNAPEYPLEDFVFRGDKVEVAYIQAGLRSDLGKCIWGRELMLREGLLGGPLSAANPLENIESRQAKVTYDGLKKIDGRQLHVLSYRPRKNPDEVTIKLFFDENFHHVMTRYSWAPPMGMGRTLEENARMQQNHHELEETFSNFRQIGALTLPTTYVIRYYFTQSDPSTDGVGGGDTKNYIYQMYFDHYNKTPIAGAAAPAAE